MFTHTSDAVTPTMCPRKSLESLQSVLHFISVIQSEGDTCPCPATANMGLQSWHGPKGHVWVRGSGLETPARPEPWLLPRALMR